ncbi:MAG: TIGR02281 family clan AA aspartic protease [Pseudolabrys sp.]|nr:TIGR02281 family clan AA aspartic protease [Pseudolabrys sp.]MBV9954112.1 TIGR02281 family clan AA aspartic protease [Pseudolabrys sp.]
MADLARLDAPRGQQRAQIVTGARSIALTSDRSGHFRVDANVNSGSVAFVVDSGASQVVLRESDAFRIGVRPTPNDYTATVSTANGEIKAARTRLDRVTIGDIAVNDVSALVLPDKALSQNLLGVSFLSRLKRYEYANGRMVLEQ